jgi:endonuclease G
MRLLSVLFISLLLQSFPAHANNDRDNPKKVHAPWGYPKDAESKDDYIIERKQYVISYNPKLNAPNWVAWQLNAGWYGDTPRKSGKFITDTTLPAGFERIVHDDYTRSGYDRGHVVRSEERTASEDDNRSTFLMTNVFPQTPTLNQQTWLSLEYECERLCKTEGKELYVIAGGVFSKQPLRLNGKVAVPDSCWKIVVILDKGQKAKDISSSTKVIAVMMNNGQYDKSNNSWELYKTTINAIEKSTGYDFLRDLPDALEEQIESK